MPVTNARGKLVHELRMGYDEEHRYLEVQRRLMDLTSDEELKDLLKQHTEETLRHIQNLEQALALMGQEAERAHNRAAEGMVEGAQQGAQSAPEGPIRHCLIAGAQGRIEALEITGYRELLGGGQGCGRTGRCGTAQAESPAGRADGQADRAYPAAPRGTGRSNGLKRVLPGRGTHDRVELALSPAGDVTMDIAETAPEWLAGRSIPPTTIRITRVTRAAASRIRVHDRDSISLARGL